MRTFIQRMRGLSLAATLSLLFAAGLAHAQSRTTGEVVGTVTDASKKPVAGANVIAIGPQGARTTSTNEQGEYRLDFLPPGEYSITASAEGLQAVTVQGVSVQLDQRTRSNIQLQPMAEVAETITVTAEAPTVDTQKTSTSTNIDSDLLGKVPTGRSIGDVLDLAPGVTDGGDSGPGNPSISGASGLENTYLVDGVNITNTGYGSIGSYSIVYGSLGTGVNFDFVDTVQVKSAGFEAEYGQALGGIVNVITKRGTNEVKGSVFGYYSPNFLQGNWRTRSDINGNTNIVGTEGWDVGVEVGGPVIKDKLFFFIAADPQQSRTQRQVADQDPNGDGVIDFPLGGKYVTVEDRAAYAGKLTWNVVPNHRLELSVFGDPGRSEFGAQSGTDILGQDEGSFSELKFGGHNQVLRYDGVITDWMTVEAQVSHANNVFAQSFPSKNNTTFTIDQTVSPNIVSGGVGFYEKEQISDNTQYQLKATNYFNLGGTHEVKYGLAYEDIRFSNNRDRTGSQITFTDEDGVQHTTQTGTSLRIITDDAGETIFRHVRGTYSDPNLVTNTDYFSLFLQDKYSPIPTVTLSAGVRLEQQRILGTAAEYTFNMTDNIAPRLGAAWDFTGRGRGKVYGHFGLFYEKIPNDIAVRLLSPEAGIARVDYIDTDGDGQFDPTVDQQIGNDSGHPVNGSDTHLVTFAGEAGIIAPDTKSQYQREWVLGGEYEVIPKWNFGARWIHRELGRVLEDFATNYAEAISAGYQSFGFYVVGNPGEDLNNFEGDFYNNTTGELGPDGVPDTFGCPMVDIDGDGVGDYRHDNCWRAPERNYDALEFTVERKFADGFQLLASYRLSRLFGNYEGLFRNDNGQSDPNLTSLFDFPNNTTYTQEELDALCLNLYDTDGDGTPDNPGQYQDCVNGLQKDLLPPEMRDQGRPGLLNTDRTHIIQIAGSYTSPNGFTVGAVGRYQSGTPISRFRSHPAYENAGEVPYGKRGIDGRTPGIFVVDLHGGYEFDLPRNLKGEVLVDVLNILDNQEVTRVDQNLELDSAVTNPDWGSDLRYHPPRSVRLGMKVKF